MIFFEFNNKQPRKNCYGGFTLIEIIVSLGIFAVVAVVALGAVTRIIDANRKAQTLQSAMTNLNYALESMSRELRVGAHYYCTTGTVFTPTILTLGISNLNRCPSGISDDVNGAIIAFSSSKSAPNGGGTCWLSYAYRFKPSTVGGVTTFILEKGQQDSCSDPILDADFYPINDPEVTFTNFLVKVTADYYPLAVIKISGYAGVREKDKTYFDLQTAISPRVPTR